MEVGVGRGDGRDGGNRGEVTEKVVVEMEEVMVVEEENMEVVEEDEVIGVTSGEKGGGSYGERGGAIGMEDIEVEVMQGTLRGSGSGVMEEKVEVEFMGEGGDDGSSGNESGGRGRGSDGGGRGREVGGGDGGDRR